MKSEACVHACTHPQFGPLTPVSVQRMYICMHERTRVRTRNVKLSQASDILVTVPAQNLSYCRPKQKGTSSPMWSCRVPTMSGTSNAARHACRSFTGVLTSGRGLWSAASEACESQPLSGHDMWTRCSRILSRKMCEPCLVYTSKGIQGTGIQ